MLTTYNMPEILFIKHPWNFRSCRYDSHELIVLDDMEKYEVKEITEQELENIKICTLEQLQFILSLYI